MRHDLTCVLSQLLYSFDFYAGTIFTLFRSLFLSIQHCVNYVMPSQYNPIGCRYGTCHKAVSHIACFHTPRPRRTQDTNTYFRNTKTTVHPPEADIWIQRPTALLIGAWTRSTTFANAPSMIICMTRKVDYFWKRLKLQFVRMVVM